MDQQPQDGATATQHSRRAARRSRSQLPFLQRGPALLQAPPAASHHLVSLTLSSQFTLSPWATSDSPPSSSPRLSGGLRGFPPSLPSGLFPEGKCFFFVQIKKGGPSAQTRLRDPGLGQGKGVSSKQTELQVRVLN